VLWKALSFASFNGILKMNEDQKLSLLETFLSEKRVSGRAVLALIFSSIAVFLALYHLFTAYYGEPTALAHRSIFLTAVLVLVFFLVPLGRNTWKDRINGFFVLDVFLMCLSLFVEVYILYDIDALQLRWGAPTPMDTIVGTIAILLVLEATRRTIGWAMLLIAIFFIVHTVFGNYFPGVLNSPPTPWIQFVDVIFSDIGLYSLPLMVVSSFIILFLIFSSLLIRTGAGTFFVNLAYSIAGRLTGGPAKTAVLASALMGTLSGSGAADVVATGSFTIPLMKSVGYRPVIAGAIEAVASTGGIIAPPIMGAAAFLIAQFLAMPYLKVCVHAIIPAFLYFSAIMMMVHFEAKRQGLKPLEKGELPSFHKTLLQGGHLLLSIVALITFLALGYTAMMAAFWAILVIFLLSFIRRVTRLRPIALFASLETGARNALGVGMACACAGIIIGSLYISGLGMRFAQIVVAAAGGKLWLSLLFVMFASLVLGMGMPPTAVYLTLVTIVVPALMEMGVRPISAHLFCFYFGAIGAITPPVCLAAFAAAAIAGTKLMETGLEACKIGIAAYIIPFMFIYNSSMLMIGSAPQILWVTLTSFLGILALATGVKGWLLRRLSFPERGLLIFAAFTFIEPATLSTITGFGLMGLSITVQKLLPYPESIDESIISIFGSPGKAWGKKTGGR